MRWDLIYQINIFFVWKENVAEAKQDEQKRKFISDFSHGHYYDLFLFIFVLFSF